MLCNQKTVPALGVKPKFRIQRRIRLTINIIV